MGWRPFLSLLHLPLFYSSTSCVGWRLFVWHAFFSCNLFELYQTHRGCGKMVVCVCVARRSVWWCTRHSLERPTKLFIGRKGCCFCRLVECGKLTLLFWYSLSCFAHTLMNERWLTGTKREVCAPLHMHWSCVHSIIIIRSYKVLQSSFSTVRAKLTKLYLHPHIKAH